MTIPPQLTPEEAKTLMSGEFGWALMDNVKNSIAPIYWWTKAGGFKILSNGTIFFWNTGERLIGVTANHVLAKGWEKAPSGAICQLGDMEFDPIGRIIDRSEALDILTLEIHPEDLTQIGMGKTVVPLEGKPVTPTEGRGISLGGYPGQERRVSHMECNFGIYAANGIATSVSNTKVNWQIEREFMVQAKGMASPPPGYDPGGVSGGPMITLIERSGILTWAIGAIITDAHPDWEIMFGTRADFINPDGSISPAPA
jgi:hypothetical protein